LKNKNNSSSAQHEDFTPLNKQLQPLGLIIKEVNGDGNCLFRSVSDQMDGGEHNHEFYRIKCVDYMLANADNYAPFLEVPLQEVCTRCLFLFEKFFLFWRHFFLQLELAKQTKKQLLTIIISSSYHVQCFFYHHHH